MDNDIRLLLNNISVVYSDVIQVLKGVSLMVRKGQIVSLLGSNGAGKTTTLKAISGLLKPENGKVTEGSIEYDGLPIQNSSPEEITTIRIWRWCITISRHFWPGKSLLRATAAAGNFRCWSLDGGSWPIPSSFSWTSHPWDWPRS